MVEKQYAKWMKSPNESEVISATRALFLKSPEGGAQLVTTPKVCATLSDVETGLKVRPITGRFIKNKNKRAPNYFAYYNDEDSPLKGVSRHIEWSDELQLFMKIFDGIEKFQIEQIGERPFLVIPIQMKKLEFIDTSFGRIILKFLVDIDYTYPYSQAYYFNKQIGLEFVFSSLPTPKKLVGLSDRGITVFQAEARLSTWVKRDYGEVTDENFEEIQAELIETFKDRNYRLQGKFVNSTQTTPENKEKYERLKSYEEQVEELQKQIQALENQKLVKQESLETAECDFQKAQDLVAQEKIKLEAYKRENEYYEKLESDNKSLTKNNLSLTKNLGETTDKLNTVNTELGNANTELDTANNELKRVYSAGWIKRALKIW